MTKRTPLHGLHESLGAKMVEFAGWHMPVSYPLGVMGEHRHCRGHAALFDVSHMCQVELHGRGAAEALEALVPAAIADLPEGKARYTQFTSDAGGILDDLIVSNAGDHLYLVLNASRRDHDLAHLREHLGGVDIRERDDLALIALQGPDAARVLGPMVPGAGDLTFMDTFATGIGGVPIRVSRLGYTGEDGYEVSVPAEEAETLAKRLLGDERVEAAGLGARDSLRLEAGLCLYGQDIDETTSPVEAGLKWSIQKRRRDAADFPGAGRILREIADGPTRLLTGLTPEGRAPARAGTEVVGPDGSVVGTVTSGGFGPTVGGPVSMGYVPAELAVPGTVLGLRIRGKDHEATVTALPFVEQNYKR